MSRRESLFFILPPFNSLSSPPETAEVFQCQQKEGKGDTKSALFVTKSWIKNRQNFKYSLLQLKYQQQTLQLQMFNVFGISVYTARHRQHEYSLLPHKPLAHKSLLEREKAALFVLAESCAPDTAVFCAHPL